jgi:hypothetical protein
VKLPEAAPPQVAGQPTLRATMPAYKHQVMALAFSPHGKLLVSGGSGGGLEHTKWWDPATGQQRAGFSSHSYPVVALAFTPDAKTLVTADAVESIRVFDMPDGKEREIISVKPGVQGGLAVLPDHKTLIFATYEGTVEAGTGLAVLRELGKQGDQPLAIHKWPSNALAVSPDGKYFASAGRAALNYVFDTATKKELWTAASPNSSRCLAFSPDSKMLAIAVNEPPEHFIRFYESGSGRKLEPPLELAAEARSLAFAPDNRTLAIGYGSGKVDLWNVAERKKLGTLDAHAKLVRVLTFSPDGRTLATGGDDGVIKLWDVPLGKPVAGTVITNSIGMKLAAIPAGKFLMGKPAAEAGGKGDEGPQHEVTLTRPFYIGVFEVRQDEYEKVMGQNPSAVKNPAYPVTQVSWRDAVAFCQKLTDLEEEKKAGRVYRLPTEASRSRMGSRDALPARRNALFPRSAAAAGGAPNRSKSLEASPLAPAGSACSEQPSARDCSRGMQSGQGHGGLQGLLLAAPTRGRLRTGSTASMDGRRKQALSVETGTSASGDPLRR